MRITSNLKKWSPRVKNGAVAVMFLAAYALSVVAPLLPASLAAAAPAPHEVACHREGNGTAHAIPPSQQSSHIPGHVNPEDPTHSDYVVIATYDQEEKWNDVNGMLDEACEQQDPTHQTAVAPAFSDPCGTVGDIYTIQTSQYATYTVNGVDKPAGSYAGTGTVSVVAVPKLYTFSITIEGQTYSYSWPYILDPPSSWDFTFTNKLCTLPQPEVSDLCGLNNATWIVPEDGDGITWELAFNGELIATATGGLTFPDGTSTHNYGTAPDSGKLCEIAIPLTPTVTDLCGLNNATWNIPTDTAEVTWAVVGGELIATAHGFVFDEETQATTSNYGVAPDSGILCATTQTPTVLNDTCQLMQDTYVIPTVAGVTYYINGVAVAGGTYTNTTGANSLIVTAEAQPGYELIGQSSWTLTFTNKPCPVTEVPAPTAVNPCGTKFDDFDFVDGENYHWVVTGSTALGTVTLTAVVDNSDYAFAEGVKTEYTFTFTNTPCTLGGAWVECTDFRLTLDAALPEGTAVYVELRDADGEVLLGGYITDLAGETSILLSDVLDGYIDPQEVRAIAYQYVYPDESASELQVTEVAYECWAEEVTPVAPTVSTVCGANNDTVALPESEGVEYSSTGWVNGTLKVTATAKDGYLFAERTVTSWTFTDANTTCPQVLGEVTTTPTPPKVQTLEDTGNTLLLPSLMSAGVIGLAIATMLQNDRRGSRLLAKLHRMFAEPFMLPLA
jgi:hypothetical protein